MLVAGIDRWREGWIVAEQNRTGVSLWSCADIGQATERLADHRAVAIDMPIALASEGRREAEAELRAVLGASARSVFTSPTRSAVEAPSQNRATELNRATGGPGISAQAFGLFASIRELRTALRGPEFSHWWETHPEAGFAAMNGGTPLASKRTALGAAQRIALLRGHFGGIDTIMLSSPPRVPVDDVLDAFAALWSAERIAASTATCHGAPGRDDQGFALGIRI